jgi:hypothetical protein
LPLKAKWCHFALNTADAPEELHRLSAALKLPKERAALSFILAGSAERKAAKQAGKTKIRVISDCFPLSADSPGARGHENKTWGRYGCGERGLVLVAGSRKALESSTAGALEELFMESGMVDGKSGAYIANLTDNN